MAFAKKSLGQNFLIDKNVITKIVNLAKIKDREIVEIGSGKGALTEEILKRKPKSLKIIEKDEILCNFLKKKYSQNKNIKIFNKDILKFNLERIVQNNSIIFGNLPYNISSQILVKIIKFKNIISKFDDIVFMFQRELGKKIIGKFSSSHYGRLAILTDYKLAVNKTFTVSPNCFVPKPKVYSMIIHFKPKKKQFN